MGFVWGVSIPQWCDCCLFPEGSKFVQKFSFQSHNGAIAASVAKCNFHSSKISFNPTMVRLLLRAWLSPPNLSLLFQSHNGAIAAIVG